MAQIQHSSACNTIMANRTHKSHSKLTIDKLYHSCPGELMFIYIDTLNSHTANGMIQNIEEKWNRLEPGVQIVW